MSRLAPLAALTALSLIAAGALAGTATESLASLVDPAPATSSASTVSPGAQAPVPDIANLRAELPPSAASAAPSTSSVPGVVLVNTALRGGEGAGSGIVLSADGQVLTNYHVVKNSTEVVVSDPTTGSDYRATVVGHDATKDVALLQLSGATGLTVAQIDSRPVTLGEAVTAVGNAKGQGYLSTVRGTVTRTDDKLTIHGDDGTSENLANLIQTDADVVPGYSGGALVDARGEVVGVTTAASTGAVINGFAIPIKDALQVVGAIEAGQDVGTVQVGPKGSLGVSIMTFASMSWNQTYSRTPPTGVQVQQVAPGSGADKAGLTAGDTITSLDGTPVQTAAQLSDLIGRHNPGDQVSVSYVDQAGQTHIVTATLGESQLN